LYARYKDRGFTILAVNAWDEDADELKRFAREQNIGYPVLLKGHAAAEAWGVSSIPDNFLVDRNGEIAHKHVVIDDKTIRKVETRIEKLLE